MLLFLQHSSLFLFCVIKLNHSYQILCMMKEKKLLAIKFTGKDKPLVRFFSGRLLSVCLYDIRMLRINIFIPLIVIASISVFRVIFCVLLPTLINIDQ